MVEYTSIRIRRDIADKLQLIKRENNCKSNNELLEQLIPKVVSENYTFTAEQPVFSIGNINISWETLKQSNEGYEWFDANSRATVLFKDDFGAFIRFILNDDVYLEYFHFL